MGTNFYAEADRCDHCGRADEKLHIGKSSYGWKFLFEAHVDRGLTTWAAWKAFLAVPKTIIRDEYGDIIALPDLIERVEAKQATEEPAGERHSHDDPAGYRFSNYSDFS